MIRVDRLEKSYTDGGATHPVLRGLSLQLREGELVAIQGPSGAGKSTLLHVIGGLDRDYGGSVQVGGRELASLGDDALARYRNEEVGFVFQGFNLVPPLSALQNVLLPTYFSREEVGAAGEERARAALARVGLAGKERRLPAQLSGGERQRVALARALFRRPRVLLADEPTGSLDPATAAEVIELLRELRQREGLTVILVTHDDRVASIADRILHLRGGQLVEAGARDPAAEGRPLGLDGAARARAAAPAPAGGGGDRRGGGG